MFFEDSTLLSYTKAFIISQPLLDMGIHPLRIAEGYELACVEAIECLKKISHEFNFDSKNVEPLIKTCMTTLSSKM